MGQTQREPARSSKDFDVVAAYQRALTDEKVRRE